MEPSLNLTPHRGPSVWSSREPRTMTDTSRGGGHRHGDHRARVAGGFAPAFLDGWARCRSAVAALMAPRSAGALDGRWPASRPGAARGRSSRWTTLKDTFPASDHRRLVSRKKDTAPFRAGCFLLTLSTKERHHA